MKTQTIEEYFASLKAQNVPRDHICVKCPMCGTIQSPNDLVAAGAGKDFEEVEKYIGFSCVGRWTHQKPPPKEKGNQDGCNWTLGGLFSCHNLVVVTEDGKEHPRFEAATPEEAQVHFGRRMVAV